MHNLCCRRRKASKPTTHHRRDLDGDDGSRDPDPWTQTFTVSRLVQTFRRACVRRKIYCDPSYAHLLQRSPQAGTHATNAIQTSTNAYIRRTVYRRLIREWMAPYPSADVQIPNPLHSTPRRHSSSQRGLRTNAAVVELQRWERSPASKIASRQPCGPTTARSTTPSQPPLDAAFLKRLFFGAAFCHVLSAHDVAGGGLLYSTLCTRCTLCTFLLSRLGTFGACFEARLSPVLL